MEFTIWSFQIRVDHRYREVRETADKGDRLPKCT